MDVQMAKEKVGQWVRRKVYYSTLDNLKKHVFNMCMLFTLKECNRH